MPVELRKEVLTSQYLDPATGEPRSRFHTINWNYFPPAGGSLIHTHLQLLSTPLPHNRHRHLVEASWDYQKHYGRNYWAELLAGERGERYIGQIGRFAWLCPFVPRGRLWDGMALLEGGGSVLDLTPQDFLDLAQGLTRMMKFTHSQGFYSFNFSLLSDRRGDDSFWTQAFFLPRVTSPPMGMSDCSYLDTLLDHPSSTFFPEQIAEKLREYF